MFKMKSYQPQVGVVATEPKTKSSTFKKVGLGATAFAFTAPAFAALEITELETEIASNSASMQTVMMAVLTLVALFVGYRMIKRSLS